MPPKPKFTREEVIRAAYEITRKKGIRGLTANELKGELGSSASPIFTLFNSMEEIKGEVRKIALARYTQCSKDALGYWPAFKQFGLLMISFACDEPNLFRMLFMEKREKTCSFREFMPDLGEAMQTCLALLQKDYEVSEREAEFVFDQNWMYCYGICVLCANGVCNFSYDDLNEMLGRQFRSTLLYVKAGQLSEKIVIPEKK